MFVYRMTEDIRTTSLLDKFGESEFDMMKLKNVITFRTANDDDRKVKYTLSLFIRKPLYDSKYKYLPSNIRMGDIKDIKKEGVMFVESIRPLDDMTYRGTYKMGLPAYHFLYNIKANIEFTINELRECEIGAERDYIFEVPIQLNAQNSSNRTGYGNVYEWDKLIIEGTLYGATSSYFITGFSIKKEDLFEY